MLCHRLRRWNNIKPALGQRVVFTGLGQWLVLNLDLVRFAVAVQRSPVNPVQTIFPERKIFKYFGRYDTEHSVL